MKKSTIITEARLREIIQEELTRRYLIEEGLWDDVKSGVKKLSAKVSAKFKSLAADWATTIKEKIDELGNLPDETKNVVDAVKAASKETGESIPMDATLAVAKELGNVNALSTAEADLAGPVHDEAASLSESYIVLNNQNYIWQSKQLNEFGVITAAGIGLALVGGLPLLFKGLKKLALSLNAEKTAELFEKAYTVTHALEQKTIDYVVPDRLSYQVYKLLNEKGFHVTGEEALVSYEDYKSDADKKGARKKTDDLIYKAILIAFAINGLIGILKAGASMLGFVEGAATAVKGVEVGQGAATVARIVTGAEAAAIAAAETV